MALCLGGLAGLISAPPTTRVPHPSAFFAEAWEAKTSTPCTLKNTMNPVGYGVQSALVGNGR